jgi:uncharacterized protein
MVYALIGLIVGLIMGLTGAGGALISIPLFIHLLGVGLKEATVLSLLAVIIGTLTNVLGLLKKVDYRTVTSFVLFGAIGNWASLPLKLLVPDLAIAGLLTAIAAYSLFSIWRKRKPASAINSAGIVKSALTGLFLGVITTLTGLGGGVLLVPILMQLFGKTYEEALPTSLATILLISSISFLLQLRVAPSLIGPAEVAPIAAGAIVAFLGLRLALRPLSTETIDLVRKIVFSGVTVYSIVSVLAQSL